MVQNRNKHIQDVAALQHIVQEFLIVVTDFPKEDEQLLVAVQPLRRIGQIALHKWIVQQPRDATQTKLKILVAMDARQIVDEQIITDAVGLVRAHDAAAAQRSVRRLPQCHVVVERYDQNLQANLH